MVNKVDGLGQLAITVSDVSSALDFYRDVLGLEFLFSPTDSLAFVQSGATRIMLSTPQGAGEIGKNSIPYFSVQDIEAFFQSLGEEVSIERAPQLAAKMPDHELWIGFLRDPEDNIVGLMEEKH